MEEKKREKSSSFLSHILNVLLYSKGFRGPTIEEGKKK